MLHRYIPVKAFHRLRGLDLNPPVCRPPKRQIRFTAKTIRSAAEDPDPGYTGWVTKVARYLEGLDQENQRQLKRLNQPVRLLSAVADKADQFWFQAGKLQQVLDARGIATDQLDTITNDLAANLAIANQYVDVVLETADRAQSNEAMDAVETILDISHADQVTL